MTSMPRPISSVERAFELARSGNARDVEAIRRQVAREGYDGEHIYGLALSRQLRVLINEAKRLKRA